MSSADPGLTHLVGHLNLLDYTGRPRDGQHRSPTELWFIGHRPAI